MEDSEFSSARLRGEKGESVRRSEACSPGWSTMIITSFSQILSSLKILSRTGSMYDGEAITGSGGELEDVHATSGCVFEYA